MSYSCNSFFTALELFYHFCRLRYAAKAVDPMTGWEDEVWRAPHPPDLKVTTVKLFNVLTISVNLIFNGFVWTQHYAVPATRRFRAFKLWVVIRNYGIEGLRRYCRNHINLAKLFEKYVKRDDRFEVCGPVRFGLCAFRLKGLNEVTSRLNDALNDSRKIHMVPPSRNECLLFHRMPYFEIFS